MKQSPVSSALTIKNRYILLRHGQSEANVIERIVSDPRVGSAKYGLSAAGREEAIAVSRVLAAEQRTHGRITHVVTSPFRRAVETARVVARELSLRIPDEIFDLRERSFGSLEGEHTRRYQDVWREDACAQPSSFGAERCEDVFARMRGVLLDLDRLHAAPAADPRKIPVFLVVSHGDPLQILEAGELGLPPCAHRSVPPIPTAGWVRLAESDAPRYL